MESWRPRRGILAGEVARTQSILRFAPPSPRRALRQVSSFRFRLWLTAARRARRGRCPVAPCPFDKLRAPSPPRGWAPGVPCCRLLTPQGSSAGLRRGDCPAAFRLRRTSARQVAAAMRQGAGWSTVAKRSEGSCFGAAGDAAGGRVSPRPVPGSPHGFRARRDRTRTSPTIRPARALRCCVRSRRAAESHRGGTGRLSRYRAAQAAAGFPPPWSRPAPPTRTRARSPRRQAQPDAQGWFRRCLASVRLMPRPASMSACRCANSH